MKVMPEALARQGRSQDHIGTGHLLLALIRDDNGPQPGH
jgi:hypothetical protein